MGDLVNEEGGTGRRVLLIMLCYVLWVTLITTILGTIAYGCDSVMGNVVVGLVFSFISGGFLISLLEMIFGIVEAIRDTREDMRRE